MKFRNKKAYELAQNILRGNDFRIPPISVDELLSKEGIEVKYFNHELYSNEETKKIFSQVKAVFFMEDKEILIDDKLTLSEKHFIKGYEYCLWTLRKDKLDDEASNLPLGFIIKNEPFKPKNEIAKEAYCITLELLIPFNWMIDLFKVFPKAKTEDFAKLFNVPESIMAERIIDLT